MPAVTNEPASITIRRRVEWMDTDAAGIYHWTTVFRLAEAAEAALHTALGIADRTFGAVPRVSVAVDFRRSLRFNDQVDVRLAVAAVGRSSVRYELTIADTTGLVAAGQLTACLVDRPGGRATAWPEDLRVALAEGGEQVPVH